VTRILRIDCSPRGDTSYSRRLANEMAQTAVGMAPNERNRAGRFAVALEAWR
jgi:hypothetical protein